MKRILKALLLASSCWGQDCFKLSQPFGDAVNATNTTFVFNSDLDKIQALSNPGSYKVSSVITCFKDNKIIGQRVGLSNETQ